MDGTAIGGKDAENDVLNDDIDKKGTGKALPSIDRWFGIFSKNFHKNDRCKRPNHGYAQISCHILRK